MNSQPEESSSQAYVGKFTSYRYEGWLLPTFLSPSKWICPQYSTKFTGRTFLASFYRVPCKHLLHQDFLIRFHAESGTPLQSLNDCPHDFILRWLETFALFLMIGVFFLWNLEFLYGLINELNWQMNQYNVDIVLTDNFIFGLKYFLLAVESILGRNCVDWQPHLWINISLIVSWNNIW